MMRKARLAFINAGGTLASTGRHTTDVFDYSLSGHLLDGHEIIAGIPEINDAFDVTVIDFQPFVSTMLDSSIMAKIGFACRDTLEHGTYSGVVVGHGTASLEESAYFLHLTLNTDVPIIVTGSQRPNGVISSDVAMNLFNVMQVAACLDSIGQGVMVVMNNEIHCARDVTKFSTTQLHSFQSPALGPLGFVDMDGVRFYRRNARATPLARNPVSASTLPPPRVDISYSYADADGVAIDAFVAAGAKGLVIAGFAPGAPATGEMEALRRAAATGVTLVQCRRSVTGVARPPSMLQAELGLICAGDLSPHKARILLSLALAMNMNGRELQDVFTRA